jgi:hypothetical protein
MMLQNLEVPSDRLQELYDRANLLLVDGEYTRAEAVVVMFIVAATQMVGHNPGAEKLLEYVKEASGFTVLFFGIGREDEVVN